MSGAAMEWWAEASPDEWYWGEGQTAADGSFAMAALPTTNGEVYANYGNGATTLGFQAQQWADGTTNTFDFFPGRVYASAALGGPWAGDFEYLAVRLWGNDRYTRGQVPANGTATPQGTFDVNHGTYSWGSAKFFYDEGVEFAGSIDVTPWSQSGTSIAVGEADAQRVHMTSPYWGSGSPGATVRVARENYPSDWVDYVSGYDDAPDAGASSTAFGNTDAQTFGARIPRNAKPGYSYWIGLQHVNGIATLYLETPYQVATLKASRTAVRRGTKVRVTGVVPTAGHWGTEQGLKKVVTLYAHRGKAPVPTKWNPKRQGWVKVYSVRTNGLGAYTTPYFRPLKTLTLVVRYPGDDWYYDAYTSTQKIKVR